jgi:hypothetical protein
MKDPLKSNAHVCVLVAFFLLAGRYPRSSILSFRLSSAVPVFGRKSVMNLFSKCELDKMTGEQICGRAAELLFPHAKSKRNQALRWFACLSVQFGIQNANIMREGQMGFGKEETDNATLETRHVSRTRPVAFTAGAFGQDWKPNCR